MHFPLTIFLSTVRNCATSATYSDSQMFVEARELTGYFVDTIFEIPNSIVSAQILDFTFMFRQFFHSLFIAT